MNKPVPDIFIIGTPAHNKLCILVENEMCGILLSRKLKREVFIVALGDPWTKPDGDLMRQISMCPLILVALDSDEAGARASRWWLQHVPGTFRTPIPSRFGKDPSEAFMNGVDLNQLVSVAMTLYCEEVRR